MSAVNEQAMLPYVRELAGALGYRWPDKDALAGYLRAIGDLDPTEVERACADLAKTEATWPRPVVLRQRVESLRRRRPERMTAGVMTVGETWCDPETGEVHHLWSCRECEDTGWLPVTGDRAVLSWAAVRDGERRHAAVRRCTCKGGGGVQ